MPGPPTASFRQLYREHLPFVWSAARWLGTPDELVPDAVQEVFITMHRRYRELDWEASPRGWLYGVTRRVAARLRRGAWRRTRRRAAVAVTARRHEEPHARGEAIADLERLLAEVVPAQREVFVMSELLGLTAPEIAGELGVTVDTIYSRLRLARARLAKLAQGEGVDGAVAHARDAVPTSDESRRSWAALALAIRRPVLLAGLATSTAIGAMLVAGVIVIVAAWPRREVAQVPVTSAAAPPGRSGSDERPLSDSTPADAPAVNAPRAVSPPTSSPSGRVPAQPRVDPRTRAVAPAPSAAPAIVPAPDPASPPPAAEPTIDAELEALARVRADLRDGHASQALARLEALPEGGTLADARGALRVDALCRLGRVDEARHEARALRRAHPSSSVVRGLKCEPS